MSKKKKKSSMLQLDAAAHYFQHEDAMNVFLPYILLTCRQFQHLKYSVRPNVYTNDLIFTRNDSLFRLLVSTDILSS